VCSSDLLAASIRLALQHRLSRQTDHIEGTDQIDVDDFGEAFQPMRPFLADDFFSRRDTGAVDQPVQPAEPGNRRLDGIDGRSLAGHVGFNETGSRTKFCGQLFASLAIEVSQDDFRPALHQGARCRRPQTRPSAGHEKYLFLYLHISTLLVKPQFKTFPQYFPDGTVWKMTHIVPADPMSKKEAHHKKIKPEDLDSGQILAFAFPVH